MSTRVRAGGWWLCLVLGIAVLVRLWGLQHDLPFSYYGDEISLVKRALRHASGDMNPHWFHKPALCGYILFFEYGVTYVVGHLAGVWASVDDFGVQYIRSPGVFYAVGRMMSLVFGVATVGLVVRLGNRHFAAPAGLLGALMLALSLGHIESSRVVKEDVPSAFFICLSLYFVLNYLQDGRARSLLWAAFVGGLGAATKYYALLLPAAFVVAPWVAAPKRDEVTDRGVARRVRSAGLAIAVFFAGFFVGSPYNFLDPLGREWTFAPAITLYERVTELFYGDTTPEPQDFIEKPTGTLEGVRLYLATMIAPGGMGPLSGVLGIVGLAYCIACGDCRQRFVCLYGVAFALASIFAFPGYAEARHQVPLYPIAAVAGGRVFVRLIQRTRIPTVWAFTAFAVLMCWPAAQAVERSIALSRPATRNVAKHWIESHVPAGTKLVVSEDGPPLLFSAQRLDDIKQAATKADPQGQFTAHYDKYLKFQELAARGAITYEIHEIRKPWWRADFKEFGVKVLDSEYDRDMGNPLKPVGVESLDWYAREGIAYAIVHSDKYKVYFQSDRSVADRFPAFAQFYQELFARGELVKEFVSADGGMRGPDVKIFRIPPPE